MTTALVSSTLIKPAPEAKHGFTLGRAIPDDVFMYIAERHNPERDFLDEYWGEVFQAAAQSGIGDDLLGLLRSGFGFSAEQKAEIERLKERASQLLAGVDWEQLEAKESVFAEKFVPPAQISEDRPPIMMANLVCLLRGSSEGAAHNYEGLVAILEAIAEEANKALGHKALVVDRGKKMGAQVATMNMLAMVPGAPPIPLSLALRDDVVIIGMHEHLFKDVLALMDGSSPKRALSDDARFQAAFAQLPPAENTMVFFDMQALLKPLYGFIDTVIGIAGAPSDVTRNTGMGAEAGQLNAQALSAYRRDDAQEALDLTKQAYEISPKSTIVLYNLACFNALVGKKHEALAWLEKAVEGGFHAPRKISSDSDLDSLREEPKYKAALARATELARDWSAKDIVINSSKTGEANTLRMQAWQVYEDKDYEQGLKLVEQAYAVSPKDSQVLYALACFHALLGHDDKALDSLEIAVNGGFYCPKHIAKDPDLESIRGHERYKVVAETAKKKAAELAAHKEREEVTTIKQLLDRWADAMGVLDYFATVETTDGYAVWTESIAVLVPDARSKPIYPVFGKRRQLTDFDRYLPKETASFSVSGGLDLGELYKFVTDSIRLVGPKGEELLAKWDGVQKTLGIDVHRDLIDWTDGEFISTTLANGGGSVWLIKVSDEQVAREKVGAVVKFLTEKLPENLAQLTAKNPAMAPLAMLTIRTSPVEDERLGGFQNIYGGMSPKPVTWGTGDGYLIFGTSTHAIGLCLATARGEHPGIRENARVMSEAIVPSGPFSSVTLTDRRGMGDELSTLMGALSMGIGVAGVSVPNPQLRPLLAKIAGILGKLAPVVRQIDFYKSTAAQTTFDGKVWHSRTVTHYFSPEERLAKDSG